MKIKEAYVLQNIAGKWIVIDTDAKSVNFNKILALNEAGRCLWERLEKGAGSTELVSALTEGFQVDPLTAEKDVEKFIRQLRELECIDDES